MTKFVHSNKNAELQTKFKLIHEQEWTQEIVIISVIDIKYLESHTTNGRTDNLRME